MRTDAADVPAGPPVVVTRVVNADGRPFNVRIVRKGDHYGRDNRIEHDSAEPMLEFWDATYEHDPGAHAHDPRYTRGLGQFAGRYGLGTLIGLDGYSRDHRWSSPGLDLCDYMPEWKVAGQNVMEAIAAAEAALQEIDADGAKALRCELCDAGVRRFSGIHWTHSGDESCARVAVVYDYAPETSEGRWLAYVDGSPLRKQGGDERRYASADTSYKAALNAAPKNWCLDGEKPRRPPPRIGTTTAFVMEILSLPRHFPWLTMHDIVQSANDRGTPAKPGSVAAALSNLERDDLVEVDRTRKPFRYRKGRAKVKRPGPKLSEEMLRVLRHIKSSQPGACGSPATRQALVRRGLVSEICDDGRVRYEVSAAGTTLLEES